MRRDESDGNGSRTRSDLIDNQASFPEELATENVREGDRSELNRHGLRSQSKFLKPIQDGHSTGDWNRTNELLVQSEVQRPATATPAF